MGRFGGSIIVMPNKDQKKILFITGSRADFGKIKRLIEEVSAEKSLDYQIFATGMHMMEKYGSTVHEIMNANFKNIFSFMNQDNVVNSQMDYVLAHTITGLGFYIREFQPNLILVHGDRIEALAGAIVGVLNNIPVGHIEGGELSGTVDELLRHAVTKLSHVHFVANKEASKRLIQLGESPEFVHVIGSPDIDVMLSKNLPSLEKVKKKYDIPYKKYAIFNYHPVTTRLKEIQKNIEAVVRALVDSSLNYVVIYPNNDHGSEIIMDSISPLADNPHFRLIPSMRFEYFLTLMKHSIAMVGNSSAGIREAPVYGIPVVNIGTRQHRRFLGKSILNVPDSKKKILNALRNLPSKMKPSYHFGRGNSSKKFVKIVKTKKFWNFDLNKQFKDLS
jgi:UDP-N-acetylglucosamine 2-epimerase (hydrolysing)